MLSRCFNKNNKAYKKWYGERGITVCDRWAKRNAKCDVRQGWAPGFIAFLEDMGSKPSSKHQLDRIDPEGNYEPSNCRWATTSEQARNKRPYSRPSVRGEKNKNSVMTEQKVTELRNDKNRGFTYDELAKKYGISRATACQIVLKKTWKHV